ncbi:MAG TPA: winged helix-turn-helix transcriptional regulator [Actinomycetales bacterium]|nr:winged helix-turn-helix transcriptional regulator [Actinomycetales bacterium]
MSTIAASEAGTRERILDLVIQHGPITAAELASQLDLTAAAVRRHILALEEDGLIVEHEATTGPHTPRRGRPARLYVSTELGQARLTNAYSDIARATMAFLEEELGEEAVEAFAEAKFAALFERYEPRVAAAGEDPLDRAQALADALTADGYAATVRTVGDGFALQLCQGNCPVLRVAHEYPQLCAAETRAFGKLLDLHVQRLATLADGEHVCTTNIPLNVRPTKGQE